MSERLDFVIGGAQKSGTTTLDAICRRHPQIQMASVKETHFFDDERRDWSRPDYSVLDAFFPKHDDRLRGEATPVTLYWRPAIRRLKRYNPDLKFILLLRNPVTRAFSNWRHEFRSGREPRPFMEAIIAARENLPRVAETEGLHRYISYVDRGLYGRQIQYLRRHFPARNIHCEIAEDFLADQPKAAQRIAAFLGISPFESLPDETHLHKATPASYPSVLTADAVRFLMDIFSPDILLLESLIGRTIPEWKAAQYARQAG